MQLAPISHTEYCVEMRILFPHTFGWNEWLRRSECCERNTELQKAAISMSFQFFCCYELIFVQTGNTDSDIREVHVGDGSNGFSSCVYNFSASSPEAAEIDGLHLKITNFYFPTTKKIVHCALIGVLMFWLIVLNSFQLSVSLCLTRRMEDDDLP